MVNYYIMFIKVNSIVTKSIESERLSPFLNICFNILNVYILNYIDTYFNRNHVILFLVSKRASVENNIYIYVYI